MNDTQALEKRLAELLGYTDIDGYTGLYEGFYKTLPRWTADDAAAFQLVLEHQLILFVYPTGCYVDFLGVNEAAHGCYKDYTSKAEAVRVAIVKAVIAKLESEAAQ